MELEQEIISHLKEKFNPEAIVLVGSRANGEETASSDWDFVLYSPKEYLASSEYFKDQFLDIEFIKLPIVSDEHILQTSFAPDTRMKILLDTPHKSMERIVKRTLKKYEEGPKPLTEEEREKRRLRIDRLIQKIESRPDDEGYVFTFVGAIYEFGIRYWFELQQKWSQPIYKALPYIKEHDTETYKLLETIHGKTSPKEKIEAAEKFYERLFGEKL